MNLRRNLLLASLAAAAFCTTGAQAQDNVLRVGTDATFPPMEFVENGKRTGFDIELVEAIAKTMGKQVEWVDIDFKGLIPGLISKRFDMAVSAIYITDERKKVVDFTDSYYAGGLVVMVKADNKTINKLADLDGKKVSVQVGTKSVSYLTEKFPKVQRVEVEKNQEMFNLVDIGRADALVTGSVNRLADGRFDVRFRLWDVVKGQDLGGQSFVVTQGDLLDTLFSNGEVSQRLRDMVYAAVDAAGNEAMLNIVVAMQERCDG